MDKVQFNQKSTISMKQEGRPFPLNQDVGVLKWRLQTTDEGLMPFSSESDFSIHRVRGVVERGVWWGGSNG